MKSEIKISDVNQYVDGLSIVNSDKVFLKSGLKKMIREINANYDDTFKKAELNLKKAQQKYDDDLKSAKEKILSNSVDKIMGMFNIVSMPKKVLDDKGNESIKEDE